MITHATTSIALDAARKTIPLVSYVTNLIVTNFTANALFAVGAAPATVDTVDKTEPSTSVTPALLVNLGIPTPEQREAARQVTRAAHDVGVPRVLDPVAVSALVHRTALTHKLLDFRSTVVRGNASEIITLAGAGIGSRGMDAADEVDAALDAAQALAQKVEYVAAISRAVDAIVSASEILRVGGGAEMLMQVTGDGYVPGAVSATFVNVDCTKGLGDLKSVVACYIAYSTATERTESQAAGPDTFVPFFLDALYPLEGTELKRIPLP